MIVRTFINFDEPLTDEEKAELEELRKNKNKEITYDEDCMPLPRETMEYYKQLMRKYKTRRITKEILIAEGKIKPKVAS